MYRSDRKARSKTLRFILLIFIGIVLYPAGPVRAAQGSVPLCPDGYLIEMTWGADTRMDIYDPQGKWICAFPEYIELSPPMMLFYGSLRLIDYERGTFLNMRTGKTVGTFPADRYDAEIQGDWILAQDREAGTSEIYDSNGNRILAFPFGGFMYLWQIEGDLYILYQEGAFVKALRYDKDTGGCIPVYGECFSEADVNEFQQIMRLGGNYLITGAGVNRVVTKNWDVLYRGTGYPFRWRPSVVDFESRDTDLTEAYYFIETVEEGEAFYYNVLDAELTEVLSLPQEEWWQREIECRDGILSGIPCDVLGGRVCEGFLGNDWRSLPYAKEGETWYIAAEGGMAEAEVPQGETIEDYNGSFILSYDQEWGRHLYDARTGEPVGLPFAPENALVYLGDSGYTVTGIPGTDEEEISILYDQDNQEIGRVPGYRAVYPWYQGMWYCRNGIVDGIIDGSGSWLLRRWIARD